MKDLGRFDNFFLIVMSDYGIMWKFIKNMFVGRIENCMLLFVIVVFLYIKVKYFYIFWNFEINIKCLFMVYDVYEILVDILWSDFFCSKIVLNENEKFLCGISFFWEILEKRLCDDVVIFGDYCVCNFYD